MPDADTLSSNIYHVVQGDDADMKIITINREYGAGGHSIGQAVADELGIAFYDRDIIKATAAEMHLDTAQIEKAEEEISTAESIIRHITPISFEYKDYLYDAQKKVILDIAAKGPCVILGRCADAILKEAGIDALHVFLYADDAHRAAWVARHLKTEDKAEIQRVMKRKDKTRRAYYEVYTDRHFGDRHNYDLMLNSGHLGYETCENLIVALAKA